MILKYCALLSTFFFIFSISAKILDLDEKKLDTLSSSSTWLKLLNYEDGILTQERAPTIHSQRFYLSQDSSSNAKQELISTLKAFKISEALEDINQHPQCRFPARFIWLNRQLDLKSLGIKKIDCPEYKLWSKNETLNSISLVFATGYLGNPASYYGHTLLKLNSSSKTEERLLDISINFGADVPSNEDPVSYMLKGLVGGYDGSFTHSKYYFHTQNYLENELRNMWEYKLNLSRTDQQFLLAHIWELIEQDYTYYFLNKNCVSRMYALLSIIDGVELPKMNPLWVVPQEVIRAVNSATYNDAALIKEITYIPSRQTQFYDKYWQLSSAESGYATIIINDFDKLKELPTFKLTQEQQFRVLAVLLDYYQFVIAKSGDENNYLKERADQILAARYRLPIGKPKFEIKTPLSPHYGRSSSYTQFSWVNNQTLGSGLKIKIRPTYYDQLDGSTGHINNALLKMGEIEFEHFNSELRLSALTIFDVISVNDQATGLPKDNFDAWKFSLGMKKQDLACSNCLDFTVKGSKGWAFPLSLNITSGFFVGAGLTENYQNRGRVYISTSTFLTSSITDHWSIKFDIETLKYIEYGKKSFTNYSLESRYQFNVGKYSFDARLGVKKHRTEEVIASLGYYW